MYKIYNKKTFEQLLRKNGYHLVRICGSHFIYKNAKGNTISYNKDLNKLVARRLIKENNLIDR